MTLRQMALSQVTIYRMQVISPNAISPKNLVESFRLRKLGEMTKRE